MFKPAETSILSNLLKPLSERADKNTYFIRAHHYGNDLEQFLNQLISCKNQYGLLISEKFNNPDEKQLEYYETVIGHNFENNPQFILQIIQKWLPQLNTCQHNLIAESTIDILNLCMQEGKSINMLKNMFVKFMCWSYYKMNNIINKLGRDSLPKVIYIGSISNHELLFLRLIAECGCDVVMFIKDEESYKKADKNGSLSFLYKDNFIKDFPAEFSPAYILNLNQEKNTRQNTADTARKSEENSIKHTSHRINIPQSQPYINTNTWLSGNSLEDILKEQNERGNDNYIYNAYIKITGVWNKATYTKDLFLWQKKIEQNQRKILEIEAFNVPAAKETERIPRRQISSKEEIIGLLYPLMWRSAVPQLDNIIYKAFYDTIMNDEEEKLNRLNNKAVYILCWFNRFASALFSQYIKNGKTPVVVYFNGCKTNFETIFFKFLSNTPVDILILCPDENCSCLLEDKMLFVQKYDNHLKISKLPATADDTVISTAAYNAEQELTNTLYTDSGIYRHRQYHRADSLKMQTMLEEINILWHEPGTFRPGFETIDNTVLLPVIAAKINGVKDDNKKLYWENIRKKLGEDTLFISQPPYISHIPANKLNPADLFKNGKLQRDKIKNSHAYKYKILRNETQEHILDKLQLLIDSKIIQGTFSQGMEYRIINVILNMNKDIIRLIQKFDFTKYIPKVVAVACSETNFSLDDAILFAFLHFAGFDIALYAPTGYQVVESYYTEPLFINYEAGQYEYDYEPSDIDKSFIAQEFISKIFGRK